MRIHMPFAAALLATTALTAPFLVTPALAACTSSANNLTLSCSGALSIGSGLPITIYDAAAAYQPVLGSNSYTPANPAFPAASNPNNPGYNPNPATVTLNFDSTTNVNVVNPASSALADKGLISANYSNSENPAVNTVQINNAGTLGFSTNQISATRIELINADSQVNNFTVSNTGTLSVTQTYFSTFSAANLAATSSGSPATYSAKYAGNTLNDMAVLFSDDNTNEFTLNNAAGAKVLATGNYATAYYGRADVTINNSGTIANTNWSASDTIASGHWAIATWAGTDYVTAANTNPDSAIVLPGANGSVGVADTSALTLTNAVGGVIKGDILALDITPLVYAAAVGSSTNPFANPTQTTLLQLPISNTNAGPRDSNIENYGSISGNFYLGSGTHVIDNAAGAALNGGVYVDQRPIQVVASEPTPGAVSGTYVSAGIPDFNGDACPAAGASTTNPGCATTTKVTVTVVGGQSLTLTNEGAFNGDIKIFDQATSVNSIALTGGGFSGNIVALNGAGQNSLVLNGVPNLASVNNFSSLDLTTSQVTVAANATTITPGVTLVANSTLATTITGPGGTLKAPNSTNLGSIYGTLTLAGATTITPTYQTLIRNGDVYQLASTVNGAGVSAITVTQSGALATLTADTSTGALLLDASVVNASAISGLSKAGVATLNNLLSYGGTNANVQTLGAAMEALPTLAAVRAAGEQLRPSVNGASIQTPLAINDLFTSRIDSRIEASIYGALPGAEPTPRDFVGSASVVKGPLVQKEDEGLWINAAGASLTQDPKGGVAGYNATFGGFIVGLDRVFAPGARVGAAIGYAAGNAPDKTANGDKLRIQDVQGLVYGSLVQGPYYVLGDLGLGGLNYRSTRIVSFTGFYDDLAGQRSGLLFTARAEAGRAVTTAFGTLIPLASVNYAHIDQGAYTETGANGAALSVAKQATDSLQSGLGGKAVIPFATDSAFAAALDLRAVWRHEFLNTAEVLTANFAGGTDFQAAGPAPTRDTADVGAALRFALPALGETFEVGYTGRLGAGYAEHVGLLRARYDF